MIKIPLISNQLLEETNNVEFKLNNLQFDRKVFTFRERNYEKKDHLTGQYSHIIENNGKLQLYYQAHPHEEEKTNKQGSICYAESVDDGLTFTRPNINIYKLKSGENNNIIFMEGLSSNNFQVFMHQNKYYAIGGYQVDKNYHRNCRCNKLSYPEKFINDPVWPGESRNKISWEVSHPCHGNGIYLFKSEDGVNWKQESNKPIIHHGFKYKGLNKGTLGFDGCPKILFDEKTQNFLLYIRGNIKLGVRHILFSKSKDLYNWSDLETIKLPDFDFEHDNYYFPSIYKYPDTDYYIGFISFFKNKILNKSGSEREYWNETNKIIFSIDGLNWDNLSDLTIDSIVRMSNKEETPGGAGHSRYPHIINFRKSNTNNEMHLYVQQGYFTWHNILLRYKWNINKMIYLTNKDNKHKSFFIIKKPKNNKSINFMNLDYYLCNEDSYIGLEFLKENREIDDNISSIIINNNFTEKIKLSDKTIYIKIIIYKSKIYSVIYDN